MRNRKNSKAKGIFYFLKSKELIQEAKPKNRIMWCEERDLNPHVRKNTNT
jgi:hypothetical protein